MIEFDQLDQISLNYLHRLLEIFRNLLNINNLVGHDMLLQSFQPDLVEYLGVAMMTKEQIILETVTNLMQLRLELNVITIQKVFNNRKRLWRVL